MSHGLLAASGTTAPGPRRGDALELGVDDRQCLYAVLLSVDAPNGVAGRVLESVSGLVRAGAAVPRIVAAVEASGLGIEGGVRTLLVRFHQPGSRVELLNAGMPPLACHLPGDRWIFHPARSPAIGIGFRQVHPYELLPLVWGSAWVASSPGLFGTQWNEDAVRARFEGPAFRDPAWLAAAAADALREAVANLRVLDASAPPARDATLVVVDSSRRARAAHKSIPAPDSKV